MKSSISVGSPGGLRGYVGEGRLWGASFLRGCFPLGKPQSCGKNEAGVGTTSVGFLRKSTLNASYRRETLGFGYFRKFKMSPQSRKNLTNIQFSYD